MAHDAPIPGDVAENARVRVSEHSNEAIDIAPYSFQLPLPVGWISWDATKVLRRLQLCGHTAYLVGGCVRDLLLGRYPKDFDVATSARPREVKRAFVNCRLIGRRFRLAHILFNESTIEVATFRRDPSMLDEQEVGEFEAPDIVDGIDDAGALDESKNSDTLDPSAGLPLNAGAALYDEDEGMEADFDEDETSPDFDEDEEPQDFLIRSDNVFGTPREDALRRDFTINGLFYDLSSETVIDWSGGVKDIEERVIRTIGDPVIRFREDPIRMLRAIKFASSLGFEIEPATWEALCLVGPDIQRSAPPRVLEEILRMMRGGASKACFDLLEKAGLLTEILPEVVPYLGDRRSPEAALEKTSDGPPGQSTDGAGERIEAHADTPLEPAGEPGAAPGAKEDAEGPPLDRSEGPMTPYVPGLSAFLEALDRVAQGPSPLSNPILLALLCLTPVFRRLETAGKPFSPDLAFREAGDLLEAMGVRLRVARRDRERARVVLLGFSKLLGQSGRRGSSALARKSYYSDAVTLYTFLVMARGWGAEDLTKISRRAALSSEAKHVLKAALGEGGISRGGSSDEPERQGKSKRRRRSRRGGRRSRPNAAHRDVGGDKRQVPDARLEGSKAEVPV